MHVTMLNDFIMTGFVGFLVGVGAGVLGVLAMLGKITIKVRWHRNVE